MINRPPKCRRPIAKCDSGSTPTSDMLWFAASILTHHNWISIQMLPPARSKLFTSAIPISRLTAYGIRESLCARMWSIQKVRTNTIKPSMVTIQLVFIWISTSLWMMPSFPHSDTPKQLPERLQLGLSANLLISNSHYVNGHLVASPFSIPRAMQRSVDGNFN